MSLNEIALVEIDDAASIGQLYVRARSSAVVSVNYLIECGRKLTTKKQSLGHGQWLPWLMANERVLGFTERTARMLMAVSNRQLTSDLDEAGATQISREIWGNATPPRLLGTEDNEWYTPAQHIELARRVLGEIDLDPASCEAAQRIVRAKQWFSKQDDGLRQKWYGRIFMNPPYSKLLLRPFVTKLCEELSAGDVTAAIMLVHNNTDASWFHEAAEIAQAVCFTRGRIAFLKDDGEQGSPPQGQAFFYFGMQPELFADVFNEIGIVLPTEWATQNE
jgi:phage N-6-adenine-methyltransferase